MERRTPPSVIDKLMAAFSPIRGKKQSKPKLQHWQQSPKTSNIKNNARSLQRTESERAPKNSPTRPNGVSSSRTLKRCHSEKLNITHRQPQTDEVAKSLTIRTIARSSSPVPCSPLLRPTGHAGKIPPLPQLRKFFCFSHSFFLQPSLPHSEQNRNIFYLYLYFAFQKGFEFRIEPVGT